MVKPSTKKENPQNKPGENTNKDKLLSNSLAFRCFWLLVSSFNQSLALQPVTTTSAFWEYYGFSNKKLSIWPVLHGFKVKHVLNIYESWTDP